MGALPGYNGGGGDVSNWNGTGTRGGGGCTTVQLNETTYGADQVIVAGGGGASNSDAAYSGRTGGDGGYPSAQNGVGANDTNGKGAYGTSNPGFGGVNPVYGVMGTGTNFQGGGAIGWLGVGGGGGGGGYTGGGGGVTSCDKGPPASCPGATGGGGGGGLSYFGPNMQKTGTALKDYDSEWLVSISWTAGPSVP